MKVVRCTRTAPCRGLVVGVPHTSRTMAVMKAQRRWWDWPKECPSLCHPPLFCLARLTSSPPSHASSCQVGKRWNNMVLRTKRGLIMSSREWQEATRQGIAAKMTECFHGLALISRELLCVQLFHTCDSKCKCMHTVPQSPKAMWQIVRVNDWTR